MMILKIQKLLEGKSKINGRNNQGRITIYHRGGGHKQAHRKISFKRDKYQKGITKILYFAYSPNRTSSLLLKLLFLSFYTPPLFSYVLISDSITKPLPLFMDYTNEERKTITTLNQLAIGSRIFNLEAIPKSSFNVIRSKGSYGTIIEHYSKENKTLIKLPSGELKKFSSECSCQKGPISIKTQKISLRKAGAKR